MKNEIQISVLMSVFNGENYLQEAIESILTQTYKYFEFIIINDGSTDTTEKIILSFIDERIIYIKNKTNLGLIASLNNGIQISKGKFIARMDSDDIALSQRLQLQLNAFQKNEKLICVSSDYFLFQNKKLTLIKNNHTSDYLKTILLFSTCFCHPTVMIKNNCFVYDENFIHAEDYKLWTDLSFEGQFYNVSQALLKYRSHSTQISVSKHSQQLEISKKIREEYLKKLGFQFSTEQFEIHNIIGDNQFIINKETLIEIEKWFLNLIEQNKNLKKMNEVDFNTAIHKYWMDSCGYTNLGIIAFNLYRKSVISKHYSNTKKNISIVFLKCLIRKFISIS